MIESCKRGEQSERRRWALLLIIGLIISAYGVPYTLAGAVLATALAVLLSWIAGMRSVAWTDAFQALVMIITATWVVLIVIDGLGGFSAFFGTLEARKPELLAVPGNGFFSISTFIGLTLPWFFSVPSENGKMDLIDYFRRGIRD